MNKMFAGVQVGKKNVVFGIGLFILLAIGFGVPLTINFFGGSVLTHDQYQTWKVVHAYGIFLGFINYFFGLIVDRLGLNRQQKELSSWAFLAAGIFGGVGRMILVLLSAMSQFGLYLSLGEIVFITLGTIIFLLGQSRTITLELDEIRINLTTFRQTRLDRITIFRYTIPAKQAGVAELADAHDSKSCSLGSVGSIPTFGISPEPMPPLE